MTHGSHKLLKIMSLDSVQKVKNGRRLPLVDSIGLSVVFMVKIECRQGQERGVADLALQAIDIKRLSDPAVGR